MSSSLPVEEAVSAGGVVYKFDNSNQLSILLCGRKEASIWGLPKGTPEPGETLEQTSGREVTEETGLKGEVQDKVKEIHYWFTREGIRYSKTVHFYLFSPNGGSIQEHDHEFDFVTWFPWEETLRRLTYKDEIEVVKQALKIIRTRYAIREEKQDQAKR